MYENNSAEEMAFPCLFPNEVNGLHTARDTQITLLNADITSFSYLLWSTNLLKAFMNHILSGASKPIGEIKDYFWRVEF